MWNAYSCVINTNIFMSKSYETYVIFTESESKNIFRSIQKKLIKIKYFSSGLVNE
jgi:hypothetical protein